MAAAVNKLVRPLIAVFVGVALIPAVQTYIDGSNVTGTAATLVGLIPFFYALTVFLMSITGVLI